LFHVFNFLSRTGCQKIITKADDTRHMPPSVPEKDKENLTKGYERFVSSRAGSVYLHLF
jgi:hypothetical protein